MKALAMILTSVGIFNLTATAEEPFQNIPVPIAPINSPMPGPPPAPPTAPPIIKAPEEKKSTFFANIILLYDTGTTMNANGNLSGNGKTISFSEAIDTSSAPGIGISEEWNQELTEHSSSGIEGGFAYQFPRNIAGSTVTGGAANNVYGGAVEKETINTSLIFLNGKFYFEKFYGLAGFNYPILSVTGVPLNITPALGYQFGLGVSVFENWGIEAQYRIINATGSTDDTLNGIQIHEDVDSISISSFIISLKYSFK